MSQAAEEQKQPQDSGATPLLTIGNFREIRQMADAFYNIADTKLARRRLTPEEESKTITSLIVNLQEFVMDIVGSDDAFDEIIFQARDKRIKASREPEDVMKSIKSYTKEAINQVRSVQNLIKRTLTGDSEKNNVFIALNSVKLGITNQIES